MQLKTYEKLLARLYAAGKYGVKLGLENVLLLDKYLKYPSKKFPSVHIAGTNGKGSVGLKISKAIKYSNYKVGLFSSPHFISYRERIKINDRKISRKKVIKLLTKIFSILDEKKIKATFFEITTMLAFLYFAEEKVDIAIIETGLGGRLDATNIIHPILSIITSISFDHEKVLGCSLEEIAREKAGIIKPNIPLILGPRANFKNILQVAKKNNSFLHVAEKINTSFDDQNSLIAKDSLHILKNNFHISDDAIKKGLSKRPNFRLKVFTKKNKKILRRFGSILPSKIIFDVAHNTSGVLFLIDSIKNKFPNKNIDIFFSLNKEKDFSSILKIIDKKWAFSKKYLVTDIHEKLVLKKDLKDLLNNTYILSNNILKDFPKALKSAKNSNSLLVVFGSFYFISEIVQSYREFS